MEKSGLRWDDPNFNKDLSLSSDRFVLKLLFTNFILKKVSLHKYVVSNIEKYPEAKCLKFGNSSFDKNL